MDVTGSKESSQGRLASIFSDDIRFWKMAAVFLGIVSLFRGLRLPLRNLASQSLVNYDHGLIKRGLYGATFGHWFHTGKYVNFSIVSYSLLFLFLLLLMFFTSRAGVFQKQGTGQIAALFFSSYAITYFGNTVGKGDATLGCLVVVLLLIADPAWRFLAAVPVSILAILTHEMFLIVFLPVVLFSLLLDSLHGRYKRGGRSLWIMCISLILISTALTTKLSAKAPLSIPQRLALQAECAQRADFPLDTVGFDPFSLSTRDNLKIMEYSFHSLPWVILFFFSGIVTFSIIGLPLIWVNSRILGSMQETALRGMMAFAALVATLAPLLMNALGTDSDRWDAFVVLNAYLVFVLLCRNAVPARLLLPAGFRNALLLILALGMASGEGLVNYGKTAHPFPFVDSTFQLIHAVRQTGWHAPLN